LLVGQRFFARVKIGSPLRELLFFLRLPFGREALFHLTVDFGLSFFFGLLFLAGNKPGQNNDCEKGAKLFHPGLRH
jgi:hypothetical protein